MQSISTIGLDIAKSVFQVHGVDAAGQVVLAVPVDPAIRTTHSGDGIFECVLLTGT
jgi:hypothetical protein